MRSDLRRIFHMLVPKKTLITSSSLTHVCKLMVFVIFFTFMSICVVLFFQLISIAISSPSTENSSFDLLILSSSSQTSSEERGRTSFFASLGLTEKEDHVVSDQEDFDHFLLDHLQGTQDKEEHIDEEEDVGWQPVSGSKDKFYVYSAFLDVRDNDNNRNNNGNIRRNAERSATTYFSKSIKEDRNTILLQNVKNKPSLSSGPFPPMVRIISITRTKILSHPEDNVFCRFFYHPHQSYNPNSRSHHYDHKTNARYFDHDPDHHPKSNHRIFTSRSKLTSEIPSETDPDYDSLPEHGSHHKFYERKRRKRSKRKAGQMQHDNSFSPFHDASDSGKETDEEEEQEFKDVRASFKVIRENWNLRYSAAFVFCPLIYSLDEDEENLLADYYDERQGKKRKRIAENPVVNEERMNNSSRVNMMSSERVESGSRNPGDGKMRQRLEDLRIPYSVSVFIKNPSSSASTSLETAKNHNENGGDEKRHDHLQHPRSVSSPMSSSSSPSSYFRISNRLKVNNRFSFDYELSKRGKDRLSSQHLSYQQEKRAMKGRSHHPPTGSYADDYDDHNLGYNNNPDSLTTTTIGATTTNTRERRVHKKDAAPRDGKDDQERTLIKNMIESPALHAKHRLLHSLELEGRRKGTKRQTRSIQERDAIQRKERMSRIMAEWNDQKEKRVKTRRKKKIAVCVKPIHYDYDKLTNFIQFVEFNRILGVDKFLLYNHTIGPRVGCLLNQIYTRGKESLVEVVKWNLPLESQKEIRTEGLFASLNDCLYRTMYKFDFVLMIDFDELIIPHADSSLQSMISVILQKSKSASRAGAFSFQNSFFYLQWEDDVTSPDFKNHHKRDDYYPKVPQLFSSKYLMPDDKSLIPLRKTRRKSKFHPHKQRSKCIINPRNVIEMGNHFVWEFISGKSMINVSPSLGFLHHYRICEFGGNDCIKDTSSVVDKRTHFWGERLISAFHDQITLFEQKCGRDSAVEAFLNFTSGSPTLSMNESSYHLWKVFFSTQAFRSARMMRLQNIVTESGVRSAERRLKATSKTMTITTDFVHSSL